MTHTGRAIRIPSLPPEAESANYIYPNMDLEEKHQDLLTIVLTNGYTIEAGWYPECDPHGKFLIQAFDGYNARTSAWTQDPYEAVQLASQLAWRYSTPTIAVANTESKLVGS